MKIAALFAVVVAGAMTMTSAPAGAFAPTQVSTPLVAPAPTMATSAFDYYRSERRTTRTHTYGNRTSWGWRTNCRTQYRHGHRERVCRRIRYRR